MTRLYQLTKKGEQLLKKLEYSNNKHVKMAEKILFPAIKPINKGDDYELSEWKYRNNGK